MKTKKYNFLLYLKQIQITEIICMDEKNFSLTAPFLIPPICLLNSFQMFFFLLDIHKVYLSLYTSSIHVPHDYIIAIEGLVIYI